MPILFARAVQPLLVRRRSGPRCATPVRIRTTKEHVQLYFDEYIKFEDGVFVLKVGPFDDPPTLADVARLELEKEDIDDLWGCKPGDCDVKVGSGLTDLKAEIDRKRPDYAEQLNAFVRRRLVDYVKAYAAGGDEALVSYNDRSELVRLAQVAGLLTSSPCFHDYAPELRGTSKSIRALGWRAG